MSVYWIAHYIEDDDWLCRYLGEEAEYPLNKIDCIKSKEYFSIQYGICLEEDNPKDAFNKGYDLILEYIKNIKDEEEDERTIDGSFYPGNVVLTISERKE